MGGIAYEWDSAKRESNIAKHGIDFIHAQFVFDDPRHYTELANTTPYGEVRWKAVGAVNDQAICVIFTDRDGKRRIISARSARRDERARYGAGAQTA